MTCNKLKEDLLRHSFVFMQERLIPFQENIHKKTQALLIPFFIKLFTILSPFYDMHVCIWFHFNSFNFLNMYSLSIMINKLCINNLGKLGMTFAYQLSFPIHNLPYTKRNYLGLLYTCMNIYFKSFFLIIIT